MTLSGKRQFKPLKRPSAFRDAKLVIIATEDTRAEPKYFRDIAAYYKNPKVHVEVLTRTSTASAPEHVIGMLDGFKGKYRLKVHDELWMVIDVDRWGEKKLRSIAAQCLQKGYFLAVSNPCSDIWFLLHKRYLEDYPQETLKEFMENKKRNKRTSLEVELVRVFGEFNKGNLNTSLFLPLVKDAIERSRKADTDQTSRWPTRLGTRIYLLAEKII